MLIHLTLFVTLHILFVPYAVTGDVVTSSVPISNPIAIWSSDKLNVSKGSVLNVSNLLDDLIQLTTSPSSFYGIIVIDHHFTSTKAKKEYAELKTVQTEHNDWHSWSYSEHLVDRSHPIFKLLIKKQSEDDVLLTCKGHICLIDITINGSPREFITKLIDELENKQTNYMVILTQRFIEHSPIQSIAMIERQLQEAPGPTSQKKINIQGHEFASILYIALFTIIILIAVTCLMDVDGPASFEDAPLAINKEY